MRRIRSSLLVSLASGILLLVMPVGAATLLHMDLEDLCGRADKIFRGTAVGFEPGTLAAGGGELPIVTWRFRVDETFKGAFDEKDGVRFVEVRMLGNLKQAPQSEGMARFSALPEPPQLRVGEEYLLFTTAPSAVGMSTTVGLGQGSFHVYVDGKQGEMARNELDNLGVFEGLTGMPAQGPVAYTELARNIHEILGQ